MDVVARCMALAVTLIVCACGGGGGSSTSISVSPSSLSFKATTADTQRMAEIAVNYDGDGAAAGYPPEIEVPAWLISIVPIAESPGKATFAIKVNAEGLAPGAYSTTLRFATGKVDSQGNISDIEFKDVRVALKVDEFSLSPEALNLESLYGATTQLTGALMLQIADGRTWTAVDNQPWLSVKPSGTGPGLIDYTVTPAGLALGIHRSTVTMTAAEGLTDTTTVTLTVRASRLTASPAGPIFTVATDNASAALQQSLYIADELDQTVPANALSWSVQSISAPWLKMAPTSGSSVPGVDATLSLVEAQLATMANGTYTAQVILAYTDAENQARTLTVPVTLNLNSPLQAISVTPGNTQHVAGSASVQFKATGTYATGYSANLTNEVDWASSNAVATVGNGGTQAKGLGTPIAPGAATITAAMPGTAVSGAATITITAPLGYAYLSGYYDSAIYQFIFGSDGELAPMNGHESVPMSSPIYITRTSPSGNFAYAISGQGIHQFSVAAGGYLEPLSPAIVPRSANSGFITIDPSEHYLYAMVQDLSSDPQHLVRQYRIGSDGRLSPLTPATITTTGFSSIVASPIGGYVFTLNSAKGVTAYSIGTDGTLTKGATSSTYSSNYGSVLAIHPTGHAAYTITQYDIQQYAVGTDGKFTLMSPPSIPLGSGTTIGSHIVVDATGRDVYAVDSYQRRIRHFKVGTDFKLTASGTDASGVPYTPIDVAIEPSGKYLYVTGNTDLLAKYTLDENGDFVGEPTFIDTNPYPRGFSVRAGQ